MSRSFHSEASAYGLACSDDGDNHRTCHIPVYCFSLKMRRTCWNTKEFLVCSLSRLKPGLHIVVTIAEDTCGPVLKRVLKLLIYRSQTFLVKYKHMRSLQLCEDQGIPGKLKKRVHNLMLSILTINMKIRLWSCSQWK